MAFALPTTLQRRAGLLAAAAAVALLAWLFAAGVAAPYRLAAWLIAARGWAGANVVAAAFAYAAAYVAFAALPFPGAWVLAVAGGALFGPWLGASIVSVSGTLGATLAMLATRRLFREAAAARFPALVARFDRGVARDGARYLLAARLTPLMPAFAVNVAIGLTRMPAHVFALVTMVGALPLVVLYVTAGDEFASIAGPGDVVSARAVVALTVLAAAPLIARRLGVGRAAQL